MKPSREYVDFLRDKRDSAAKCISFVQGMDYAAFSADEKTQYAVVRAFEILGEASKKIPKSFRDKHPDVPWRIMAGMRDRLIHGYFGVDTEVLWRTTREDLPNLLPELDRLLAESEGTNRGH